MPDTLEKLLATLQDQKRLTSRKIYVQSRPKYHNSCAQLHRSAIRTGPCSTKLLQQVTAGLPCTRILPTTKLSEARSVCLNLLSVTNMIHLLGQTLTKAIFVSARKDLGSHVVQGQRTLFRQVTHFFLSPLFHSLVCSFTNWQRDTAIK